MGAQRIEADIVLRPIWNSEPWRDQPMRSDRFGLCASPSGE